jgi:CubicO group peptidase (beta-lactamase class C family)
MRSYLTKGKAAVLFILLIILFSICYSCSSKSSEFIPSKPLSSVFPGENWEKYPNPVAAGYTKDELDNALKYVSHRGTTGLIAVVDGRILVEYGDIEGLFYVASVRKSFLATLYGNYVKSGNIDLNKSLADMNFDDVGGLMDQEKEATVADLLSARSGVYHAASNPGDNLADAPERGSKKHGEYFLYSNWDFNALGTIFEQESGKDIYDALETDICIPIGMQDFNRSIHRRTGDERNSIHLAYHMVFSTRDMARFGHLMLHKGKWDGEQVIPKDWIEKITSVITPYDEMNPDNLRGGKFGYGYLWWIFDGPEAKGPYEGAYTGMGYGGQYITVIPKLNMVVAHKTNLEDNNNKSVSRRQYLKILELIISARK